MKIDSPRVIIPQGYRSLLSIMETEFAIKLLKDFFEDELAKKLNLVRVSAPLFVRPESGLNDNLNGVERPVKFEVKHIGAEVEIVHSLAKWKRMALKKYGFEVGQGLYTDMNAIRRDERLDNLHSVYVDQWDWEKIIEKSDRNKEFLKLTVRQIFDVFKRAEDFICERYPQLPRKLPDEIFFITTQELEDMYPDLNPERREYEIAKEKKAVFIMEIGDVLRSGKKHDGRAPDYDDWHLNGDILFWYPLLDRPVEMSSMGIRVDEKALAEQLEKANCVERKELAFHRDLLDGKLPYTIGGGIGQSRLCLFFLNKAHIGEVQASVWDDETIDLCEKAGIHLL
ncbi:aspartate--ammonia ligase AsnA [Thermoclostridium stercorarium subsp. stercorarium DSM 8532]|jgi:aspartate--ammonia ligase|uniref:Aspartate--ammonia ligase n=3 Tax=Thermoclostridium stercorarium TaxID=1510 RepID=L7VLR1_THES1|nr:aspartate--ammonia ligase [Thermoclostridium stercorarium]AGC67632.1 aspartate--ammonia ligase AsnA [Thermoclostridium stercorarium subsp. stercorarium DSM 8532]AGI38680.1 aspartate-ammonia ligase [Thermoclostridium stercorarium subsp. stercorarium DSM 8532]ANW98051.1 aspartate--ammonia ligase [Thermoclostridium stercorarium subsp. thermolacticum DSM 2910]ANX00596.1 aspartate--ammonia ligase [Thermoclostridium stercorarium subsp. leptospartum DSM 9219]